VLIFSPEFGIVLVQGPFGRLGLTLLLVCLSIGACICWHIIWSAFGWRTYLPLLLLVGGFVGWLSIRQLELHNSKDLDSFHIYGYNVWSPYLLIWLGVCIIASGWPVLRSGWPKLRRGWLRTPRQWAVLLTLIAFAGFLYSLYSQGSNSPVTLAAFVVLLLAAVGGYYSDRRVDAPRWPIQWGCSPSEAIFVGLILTLSFVDLVYFSMTKPHLALIGFMFAWILISELTSGGPLGSCYKQVVKPSYERWVESFLRRARAVLNTKDDHQDERKSSHQAAPQLPDPQHVQSGGLTREGVEGPAGRGNVQKNPTSWLAGMLSFSSPGIGLVKMLFVLILLIPVTDALNAHKTLIDPFKTGAGLPSDLGQVFSDDLLSSIASIRGELEPESIGFNGAPKFNFVRASSEGEVGTAIQWNDPLEIGPAKIPLGALLAPIRIPLRMLLGVHVIDGEIHGDQNNGYIVSANSSTGEVWDADLPSPEMGNSGPSSAAKLYGPMERLARKLAFQLVSADPELAPLMTSSREALDDFERGLHALQEFQAQNFQAADSLDRAQKWFRAATLEDPRFGLAYFRLGQVLQYEGQPEAAEAAFRDSLRESPELVRIKIKMALAADLYRRDSYYGTYRIPPQPQAEVPTEKRPVRAIPEKGNKRESEAQNLWKQVIQSPAKRDSLQDLATANYWLCFSEAQRIAAEGGPHYYVPYFYCRRSEALYERLRSVRHPNHDRSVEEALVLDLLGVIVEKEGDSGGPPRRVVDMGPCNAYHIDQGSLGIDKPAPKGLVRSESRYTRAALRYFVEALDLSPDDPVIECNAAEADYALKHSGRMETLMSKASAHLNLARGANERAQEYTGADGIPARADLYYWWALKEYEEAIGRDSANVEALEGYAQTFWEWMNWYRLEAHLAEGSNSKWLESLAGNAEQYARKAVVLAKSDVALANKQDRERVAEARSAYAKVLLAQHQPEKAYEELKRAVNLVPDHPYFYEMRWDLAEVCLCAAVQHSSTLPERYILDRRTEAIDIFRKIRTSDEKRAPRERPFPENLLDPKQTLSVCRSISGNTRTRAP
jgi:tetratricopeptide (TPR) repeat protein